MYEDEFYGECPMCNEEMIMTHDSFIECPNCFYDGGPAEEDALEEN